MKCNIEQSLLDGLIDNQLSTREQLEINTHVMQCESCQHQLAYMRKASAALTTMQPPRLSDDFELKLRQKIAASQGLATASQGSQPDNVVSLEQKPPALKPKGMHSTSTLLAMAASVAVTVTGLSWFMLQGPQNPDLLVLEAQQTEIEFTAPAFSEAEIRLISLRDSDDENNQQYWNDVEVTSFDQFTQQDDGYQTFSCGSTSGDRGCSLESTEIVATLPMSSSI